jgi:hypothetical protein
LQSAGKSETLGKKSKERFEKRHAAKFLRSFREKSGNWAERTRLGTERKASWLGRVK